MSRMGGEQDGEGGVEGRQDGEGARANPQGHRHGHRCLPSPPLACPRAKPPDCYRPVPPSPVPLSLLSSSLSFLLFLFFCSFCFCCLISQNLKAFGCRERSRAARGQAGWERAEGWQLPIGRLFRRTQLPGDTDQPGGGLNDAATTLTLGGGQRRTPCPPHTTWVPAVAPRAPKSIGR